MNHPDLHFPSHTPESTAQNKAMEKKLGSLFTLPVFPNRGGRRTSKSGSDLLRSNAVCATN